MTNGFKRIVFEKDHIHKLLEFWRTVIFSDEGKFCIFSIKGCKLFWRKPCTALQKEHLVPTPVLGQKDGLEWCMKKGLMRKKYGIERKNGTWPTFDILRHEYPPTWAGVEPATLNAKGQRQTNHVTQMA
ncbi:hypothetical protein TNCV_809711 [Trichonephila clavipes]|uniref:Uncharacterized protein n=1 Tax=Trichonephila clavipes TaxID=2585209 RepID=A0A8X6SK98_TRICX|nr:hypothetical protein TNCV_809711 [Trichonephila clavipes]